VPDTNKNYRQLALAMVLQAIEDGCKGDQAAREWLEVEGAALLLLAGVQVEPGKLRAIAAVPWQAVKKGARARIVAERSRGEYGLAGKKPARFGEAWRKAE